MPFPPSHLALDRRFPLTPEFFFAQFLVEKSALVSARLNSPFFSRSIL